YGDAAYYGSRLIHPDDITAFAARPQGDGYWMATRDGGVWQFGSAPNLSPSVPLRLSKPIVGMTATPSGLGYWLVATDGGIFAFGDAVFYGSTGAVALNQPIVGMAATPPRRLNALPAAVADSTVLAEDSSVTVDVLANDSGLDDGGLTVSIVTPAAHGSATVGLDGRITYVPAANWFGTDSVQYQVADVDGDASVTTLDITVASRNDAPVAGDQSLSTSEDGVLIGAVGATDVEGDTLTYAVT